MRLFIWLRYEGEEIGERSSMFEGVKRVGDMLVKVIDRFVGFLVYFLIVIWFFYDVLGIDRVWGGIRL